RRDAKVLVGIRWFKAAGDAYVQRSKGRFVSAKVGIQSGQDRYTMALVVAHELGHVLGLDHEDRVCATMNTYLVEGHTEHCLAAPCGRRAACGRARARSAHRWTRRSGRRPRSRA